MKNLGLRPPPGAGRDVRRALGVVAAGEPLVGARRRPGRDPAAGRSPVGGGGGVAAQLVRARSRSADSSARCWRCWRISFGSPERREEVLDELRHAAPRRRGDPCRRRALLGARVRPPALGVGDPDPRRARGRAQVPPRPRPSERRRYYAESTELARAFRVPERLIPRRPRRLRRLRGRTTVASLEVTDDARQVAREVLHPQFWWAPRPLFVPIEWVTVDLLDARPRRRLRAGRTLSGGQRRVLRGARRLTRSVLPHLPDPLLANPLNKRAIA